MNPVQVVNYAAVPEIGIAIGIEKMVLGHEKLDVYRLAIGYVAWAFEKSGKAQRTIPIPIAISIPIYREPTWFTEDLRANAGTLESVHYKPVFSARLPWRVIIRPYG